MGVSAGDGTLLHRFDVDGEVLRLAWSPHGDHLAIGGFAGLSRRYSVREKKLSLSPDVGTKAVFGLAFSSSGKQLAVRTQDERLTFLNTASGAVERCCTDQGPNGTVSVSGELCCLDHSDSLTVLDGQTHETLLTIEARLPSHHQWLPERGLVFSSEGGQLAFPGSIGRESLAEAVGRLPKQIPQIQDATLSYDPGCTFLEPSRNSAIAAVTLNIHGGVDTATSLELLSKHARLSRDDGAVLTHEQALESGLLDPGDARQLAPARRARDRPFSRGCVPRAYRAMAGDLRNPVDPAGGSVSGRRPTGGSGPADPLEFLVEADAGRSGQGRRAAGDP